MTDIHLNFLDAGQRREFYRRVCAQAPDAVLAGGDIGEADSICGFLGEMEEALRLPVYFVLGNHDFYGGSIAAVREAVSRRAAGSRWLRWLTAAGVAPLTESTALIGHDSWADGRLGDFFGSEVLLTDYFAIEELRGLNQAERYLALNRLGDEAADVLACRAAEALARFGHVLVLTHVPPFEQACWHEGRISDPDYLPHFACRAPGERLAAVMGEHPDRSMTILCGHTHSPGFAKIRENLVVYTGGAVYGDPAIERIIEL